jgi:hypothetical protein
VPTINSPLGSKKFQSNMREFVVDEEEGGGQHFHDHPEHFEAPYMPPMASQNSFQQPPMQMPPQPQFINRNEIRRNVGSDNKISEAAKKRVEMLCGMSQINREVTIGENSFILRSLKSKESRDALTSSLKYDGTIEFSFEIRKQILARSLFSVSGIDVESFLGTYDFEAKLNFIDELDDAVAERLYAEYVDLNKEIKDKYSFKSEQDIKGVIEEVKK